MKERPILFSAPMVRAILSGQKTMTRRVVKLDDLKRNPDNDQWYKDRVWSYRVKPYGVWTDRTNAGLLEKCPHGVVGDRLWVRETWTCDNKEYLKTYKDEPWRGTPDPGTAGVYYRASERNPDSFPLWRPSIHMPRWASRILLEITEVRVERLQDISWEDALDEGIREETNIIVGASCAGGRHHEITGDRYFYDGGFEEGYETPVLAFRELWESINGHDSWSANPWVWVVCFRRVA